MYDSYTVALVGIPGILVVDILVLGDVEVPVLVGVNKGMVMAGMAVVPTVHRLCLILLRLLLAAEGSLSLVYISGHM